MAMVLKCHPVQQPIGTLSGSRPAVYNAQWGLELDDQVDFTAALFLATTVAPSATILPIPPKGSFFNWVSATTNVRTVNKSAIALDFEGKHLLDDGKKWLIDVRWREPVPGAWEEPHRVNRHPLDRPPYYWIEYYTETEEIFDARPRIDIGTGNFARSAGEPGPITTAAGEEVDLATDEKLHQVLVAEKFVSSPRVALLINDRFFGRINSNEWQFPTAFGGVRGKGPPATVQKFKARFLRAETTQYPEWFHDGRVLFEYFKMQVRIRLSSQTFFRQVPNRGTWKYDSGLSKVILHRDDDGVLGKVNLKKEGDEDTSNVPFLIPYQISGDRQFTNLAVGFI